MKTPSFLILLALLLISPSGHVSAATCCTVTPEVGSPGPSPDSLFHLTQTFRTSANDPVQLKDLAGEPVILAMFYASCTTVCPMLVGNVRRMESDLTPEARHRIRVVLVSLDAVHDTPEALAAFARQQGLDMNRWQLWSATAEDARTLAAALGVRYRTNPDGSIAHSSPVFLVNGRGEIDTRLENLGSDPAPFLQRVYQLLGLSVPTQLPEVTP